MVWWSVCVRCGVIKGQEREGSVFYRSRPSLHYGCGRAMPASARGNKMVNQRHTSLSVVFVDSRLLNEVSGVTNSGRHDMNSWRPIEKPHTRRRMPRPTTPRDAPSAMEELSISKIIRSISHASLTRQPHFGERKTGHTCISSRRKPSSGGRESSQRVGVPRPSLKQWISIGKQA